MLGVDEKCQVECPVCRVASDCVRAFAEGEIDFVTCRRCGVAFRERPPSATELENMYATHYEASNIAHERTHQESGEYALKAYTRFLRASGVASGTVLLDYGAGTGSFVELLRAAGVQADGLEFAQSARRHCSESRGFDLLRSWEQLPEAVYAVVTMIEVIEHLPDLMRDLAAIRRSLRPGGTLFVTTPNRRGLRARLEKGNWQEARKKFHLLLFDRAGLRQTLLQAGFSSVRSIRFSPILKPGFLFWLYGRTSQGLGLAGTLCVTAHR